MHLAAWLDRAAEDAARMEGLRRAHDRHVEEELAAEKDKEKQRKARADAERSRREQTKAERAKAGSSTPRSSRTPAPWPQGLPMTGMVDAAAKARHEAVKSASLEQAAEHSARLRQQEGERVQEELRKMEALRLAQQIQRGD
jgi:hypothetical protein